MPKFSRERSSTECAGLWSGLDAGTSVIPFKASIFVLVAECGGVVRRTAPLSPCLRQAISVSQAPGIKSHTRALRDRTNLLTGKLTGVVSGTSLGSRVSAG